uniref:Uncharacterized protein n=1 Tax=Megaviridae environmental sample TaxID=1737588 RepID=A0A5J6VKR1_9VIRU|nr:MAG: hypothetical protein [Megaviridae environmental sample]
MSSSEDSDDNYTCDSTIVTTKNTTLACSNPDLSITNVGVTIEQFYYNENDNSEQFYRIIFDVTLPDMKTKIDSDNYDTPMNPFREIDKSIVLDGFLVYKNQLTKLQLNYILMKNSELCKYTHNTDPTWYKISIIHGLVHLWS